MLISEILYVMEMERIACRKGAFLILTNRISYAPVILDGIQTLRVLFTFPVKPFTAEHKQPLPVDNVQQVV